MKYKLKHIKTGEEHLCDKVTIDGFDYYVSDEAILEFNYYEYNGQIGQRIRKNPLAEYQYPEYKKVIATNNPSIDIPKVVDEVEQWIDDTTSALKDIHTIRTSKMCLKAGYNKSQETHPFSAEDMIEFERFCKKHDYENGFGRTDRKELLQLWKEQQPKIVYYE